MLLLSSFKADGLCRKGLDVERFRDNTGEDAERLALTGRGLDVLLAVALAGVTLGGSSGVAPDDMDRCCCEVEERPFCVGRAGNIFFASVPQAVAIDSSMDGMACKGSDGITFWVCRGEAFGVSMS